MKTAAAEKPADIMAKSLVQPQSLRLLTAQCRLPHKIERPQSLSSRSQPDCRLPTHDCLKVLLPPFFAGLVASAE